MTDYEAYRMYLALRAHFQTDHYDVVKARGRIRSSRGQFQGGKVFPFQRLVKNFNDAEICDFMVANFVSGNHWGGMFDSAADQAYAAWQRRTQSMRYIFAQELEALLQEAQDQAVDNAFCPSRPGQHPLVVRAFLRNTIGPETLVLLDEFTDFAGQLDSTDTVSQNIQRLVRKYRPFLRFDRTPYQEIFHDKTSQPSRD